MTTVREIGETALIDRLAEMVTAAQLRSPAVPDFRLRLGIGDDAAAWDPGSGLVISTTDTMVQGVHFTPTTATWSDVGWKVMAANLSDLAAMGASPLCALVTLGIPGDVPVSAIDELYEGMLEACTRYRLLLAGGDIVETSQFFVTVALNGSCAEAPLTRASAKPGDVLAITGPLGGSVRGLQLLESRFSLETQEAQAIAQVHRRPEPRIEEGQTLRHAGIRCAMDVSDGLIADLSKMCRASGVGARIYSDRVPRHPALNGIRPEVATQLALGGGEDYELLFAGPPHLVEQVVKELGRGAVIGEISIRTEKTVTVMDPRGNELNVMNPGWEHLRK